MSTVNGVTTAPNAQGVVVGTGDGDKIAGSGGNDKLSGTGGNVTYYGGAGNDTFVIKASSLAASTGLTNNIAADTVINDFAGAGGWSATNNDFLALTGFGAGSTLTFDHFGGHADGSADATSQYYTVHDTASGSDYTIWVHSTDGLKLKAGDYNFY